jgi:adenine C2-methylase RlmN of 23S rRNA A2503 and tRNA A37
MNIIGLSKEELAKDFEVFRLPSYRVGQVWQWLYAKGMRYATFEE